MQDSVMTVRGPVKADELGFVLPHEHLLFDLYRVFQPHREFKIIDQDLAAQELQQFKDAGGGTIVELSTPDLGRDPKGMLQISEATDVNVVMSTGWYRDVCYPEDMKRRTTNDLAKEMINEIRDGLDGIRPGIIGEIGTHLEYLSPVEERVHRAAARAHLETGLALTTHSNATPVGMAQLDIFEDEGVDLSKVVVGHCDTYPKLDYHLALLERGAWVEFDTIRGSFDFETKRQVYLITEIVKRGYIGRLLLSQDMGTDRFYTVYGGKGFSFLITVFRELLFEAGLSREQIATLTVENPRRMLTGN